MSAIGSTTIHLILVLSALGAALALVGARRRSPAMIHGAELALNALATASTFAVLLLLAALAASDFSLVYVQQHSDRSMPLFYRLTALWGGMEGSLLVWLWLLSLLSAIAVRGNRDRLAELMPHVVATLMVIALFFAVLLALHSQPFLPFLTGTPPVGRGLNPLLQNPYMITHPPTLFLGYTGMAIPFAFAVAALVSDTTDDAWVRAARGWAMFAWYFLSLGLVLGMLWAYEELGWGGYWGWDPVENAGLLPWLTCTAFLHASIVQQRRQLLLGWTVVLAVLSFVLTIFGTFLTRSGFIDSVHAFGRSNIGYVFLGFIALVLVVSLGLLLLRRRRLRSRSRIESVLSREFFFLLNIWVLLVAAVLVLVLTVFPTLSELFGDKRAIPPAVFNRWMAPVGIALLLLTGFGPLLGWRRSILRSLRRQLVLPLGAGLLVVVALVLAGVARPLPLVVWALCAFVVVAVTHELLGGARVRARDHGAGLIGALGGLIARNRRRYGGYVVHLGVVLMYVGFGGEAFKLEQEAALQRGQRHRIGRYALRFDGVAQTRDVQKTMHTATITAYRDGELLGTLHPARWIYAGHESSPTTEVDLRRGLREDLFIAMGAYDAASGVTTFKFVVNPLVSWIWLGFLLLTIGAAIAAMPLGSRQRRTTASVRPADGPARRLAVPGRRMRRPGHVARWALPLLTGAAGVVLGWSTPIGTVLAAACGLALGAVLQQLLHGAGVLVGDVGLPAPQLTARARDELVRDERLLRRAIAEVDLDAGLQRLTADEAARIKAQLEQRAARLRREIDRDPEPGDADEQIAREIQRRLSRRQPALDGR